MIKLTLWMLACAWGWYTIILGRLTGWPTSTPDWEYYLAFALSAPATTLLLWYLVDIICHYLAGTSAEEGE